MTAGDETRSVSVRLGTVLARHSDFRRLFVGNSVSQLGSSITTIAMPLTAVVYLHASPVQMGLLGAAALLPHLVLGLPAGVWIDRMSYRRLLVGVDVAQALLLGLVPVLAALGLLRIWQLYAVLILAGVGNLLGTVAAQSFTPLLVSRRELLPANSAIALSNATVNTSGSALGGLLLSLLTAPFAIAVDAVSFMVSALCKARIRTPGRVPAERAEHGLLAGVLEGIRAVFTHRVVRTVTIAATVGAFAGQMQTAVLVLYLVRDLGLSPGLVGAAMTVSGVAGIFGALGATRITQRAGPGPVFITGTLLGSLAGLLLATAVGPLYLAFSIVVVAQILQGTGPALYGVNQQTLRQALIPADLLTRANATWRFLAYGMQSLGAVLGGVLGSTVGLRCTLIVSACVMFVGTAIAFMSPLRSLRELPDHIDRTGRAG